MQGPAGSLPSARLSLALPPCLNLVPPLPCRAAGGFASSTLTWRAGVCASVLVSMFPASVLIGPVDRRCAARTSTPTWGSAGTLKAEQKAERGCRRKRPSKRVPSLPRPPTSLRALCLLLYHSFLGRAGIEQCTGAVNKVAPGISTRDLHPTIFPGPGPTTGCCSRRNFVVHRGGE